MIDFRNMRSERDLAAYIGCSQAEVDAVLAADTTSLFEIHQIPKKGRKGGYREVLEVRDQALADAFKSLSRRFDEFLRNSLPGFPHPAAHGYIHDRSTRTNAEVHLGFPLVLKVDIRNFFPSITLTRIQLFLESLGLTQAASRGLARFVTVDGRLALGLHTSPLIANALCHNLDQQLFSIANNLKGNYSRYADDLSFSGPELPSRDTISGVVTANDFEIADEKWQVAKRGRGLFVTGLSLERGDRPRVPKQFKRSLRLELHLAEKHGLVEHIGRRGYSSVHSAVNKIHGRIQYLRGIERDLGNALHFRWLALLERSGLAVSYHAVGAASARDILYCLDESEFIIGSTKYLALALVVVEDREIVSDTLRWFRDTIRAKPFVTTAADILVQKGLHYNELSEDVRTQIIELVAGLPTRVFATICRQVSTSKSDYQTAYNRLFSAVLKGRMVLHNSCNVDIAVEQNSKITAGQLQPIVTDIFANLAAHQSRRPLKEPNVRIVTKLNEECVALPDVFLAVLGAFLAAPTVASKELEKKKRKTGQQAALRFEQLRDKFRMIWDLDSNRVFSRRAPIQQTSLAATQPESER